MAELGNWIISLLSKAPVPAKLIEGTVAGKFETQSWINFFLNYIIWESVITGLVLIFIIGFVVYQIVRIFLKPSGAKETTKEVECGVLVYLIFLLVMVFIFTSFLIFYSNEAINGIENTPNTVLKVKDVYSKIAGKTETNIIALTFEKLQPVPQEIENVCHLNALQVTGLHKARQEVDTITNVLTPFNGVSEEFAGTIPRIAAMNSGLKPELDRVHSAFVNLDNFAKLWSGFESGFKPNTLFKIAQDKYDSIVKTKVLEIQQMITLPVVTEQVKKVTVLFKTPETAMTDASETMRDYINKFQQYLDLVHYGTLAFAILIIVIGAGLLFSEVFVNALVQLEHKVGKTVKKVVSIWRLIAIIILMLSMLFLIVFHCLYMTSAAVTENLACDVFNRPTERKDALKLADDALHKNVDDENIKKIFITKIFEECNAKKAITYDFDIQTQLKAQLKLKDKLTVTIDDLVTNNIDKELDLEKLKSLIIDYENEIGNLIAIPNPLLSGLQQMYSGLDKTSTTFTDDKLAFKTAMDKIKLFNQNLPELKHVVNTIPFIKELIGKTSVGTEIKVELQNSVNEILGRLTTFADNLIIELNDDLKTALPNCGDLKEVVEVVEGDLCSVISTPLNGAWFSIFVLFWTLISVILVTWWKLTHETN